MAEVQSHTEAGEMTQIFVEFVMMQAQNAALCLGQLADPRVGEAQINIPLAKMFIDQLTVIKSKTKGNLSADEQRVLDSTLDQLQVAFVQVAGPGEGLLRPVESAPAVPVPPVQTAPLSSTPPVTTAAAAERETPKADPPEEGRKRFTKSYGP